MREGLAHVNRLSTLQFPPRPSKPRRTGLTAIIDAGPDGRGWLGRHGQEDLLEAAAPYIDYAKIWAASAATLPERFIMDKVALYKRHHVTPYTGGILFEIAWLQNQFDAFCIGVRQLGFTHIEISENYIDLTPSQREQVIARASGEGLAVIFEFGRKHPGGAAAVAELATEMKAVLAAGAEELILEQGEIDALLETDPTQLLAVLEAVGPEHILLEASQSDVPGHALRLLSTVGRQANLANIFAGDALRLEGFRCGLGRSIDFPFVAAGARVGGEHG